MLIQIDYNNADSYSGYDIGFDTRGEYSLPDGSIGRNVIIFEVDISPSVHVDNKGKMS